MRALPVRFVSLIPVSVEVDLIQPYVNKIVIDRVVWVYSTNETDSHYTTESLLINNVVYAQIERTYGIYETSESTHYL